jgi:hypothetical protein
MRIVESVLSPKPENANLRSSVLWSERNVRSLKPIQPEVPKRTSTLFNVLEGTVGFVRKNVLSLNTLSLFAGITCTVAVVLAVWAIYMFKEQKAKMRNLQNMVVDMSLSDAKQRNGGVSNIKTTSSGSSPSTVQIPILADTLKAPVSQNPVAEPFGNQMDELRKVQQEVAKLLTNPLNIVMEGPKSTVTVEDITNMEQVSKQEVNSMVRATTDQKRRFESMMNSYNVQMKEQPEVQPVHEDDNDGSDEDFLRDLELYKQQEESIAEDARQLENDLQMATTSMA